MKNGKQAETKIKREVVRRKTDIFVFLFRLFLKSFSVAHVSRFANSEGMGGQLTFLGSRWRFRLCLSQRHLAVGGIYYLACGRPVDRSPLKRKNSYPLCTAAFLTRRTVFLNEAEAPSCLEVRLLLRTHGGGVTPIRVCIDLSIAHVTTETNPGRLFTCAGNSTSQCVGALGLDCCRKCVGQKIALPTGH